MSDELKALQARMAILADDDVIVHGNAQRFGGFDDQFGHLDIGTRRCWVAGRVIMDEDDTGGIQFERAAKYDPRMHGQLSDRPMLHLLVADHAPRTVEKQCAENFVRERAHRSLQIADQFRIGGRDGASGHLRAHGLERR